MSKYIAKQSVGRFRLGEEVEGLTADRVKFLLEEGAIEEVDGDAADADADAKWQIMVKDADGNDIKIADMVTKQLNQYLKDNDVEHESGLLVDAKKDLVEAHATTPKD